MVKQELALCAWLNSQLSAYHMEFDRLQAEDPEAQALTLQRLVAQVMNGIPLLQTSAIRHAVWALTLHSGCS